MNSPAVTRKVLPDNAVRIAAAKDLLARDSHQEAVARVRFCIAESLLGVITGEVGIGKTVALRAAISQLDLASTYRNLKSARSPEITL